MYFYTAAAAAIRLARWVIEYLAYVPVSISRTVVIMDERDEIRGDDSANDNHRYYERPVARVHIIMRLVHVLNANTIRRIPVHVVYVTTRHTW